MAGIMGNVKYRMENAEKMFNELAKIEDSFEVLNTIKSMDEILKTDVLLWAIEKIKFDNK